MRPRPSIEQQGQARRTKTGQRSGGLCLGQFAAAVSAAAILCASATPSHCTVQTRRLLSSQGGAWRVVRSASWLGAHYAYR